MKAGRDELMAFLAAHDISVTTHNHQAVFRVAEGAHIKDDIAGGHTRNLFLKDKKGRYFMVTLGSYEPLNLKTLHTKIGASGRLSFGSAEKLEDYLGLYPGAVSVFGLINDKDNHVTLILDAPLMENDIINAHPMTNEATTSISKDDLLRFIKATGHAVHILHVSDPEDNIKTP